MKPVRNSEITKFVNSLEHSVLNEKQMMTISVLPDLIGGVTHNRDCTNTSCDTSRNRVYCVNQNTCENSINRRICDNQGTAISK